MPKNVSLYGPNTLVTHQPGCYFYPCDNCGREYNSRGCVKFQGPILRFSPIRHHEGEVKVAREQLKRAQWRNKGGCVCPCLSPEHWREVSERFESDPIFASECALTGGWLGMGSFALGHSENKQFDSRGGSHYFDFWAGELCVPTRRPPASVRTMHCRRWPRRTK